MRADRLLSILMLLQGRGKLTAASLASELNVSERTIYRDIDAICLAGVPIYSQHGPHGGFALIDSYRTHLTGLTQGEVRALFMLSIPAPLADLGLSDELRAALYKLAAALPAERRPDEERVRQRFYLDPAAPETSDPAALPHLPHLEQAIWRDRQIRLVYRPLFAATIQRQVAPYGLVAQSGRWYLVAALPSGRLQALPLSQIIDVELTDDSFSRPAGFDLICFWQEWQRNEAASRITYEVMVRVSPALANELHHYFGRQIQAQIDAAGPAAEDGWITLQLSFDSLFAARDRLLAFGRAVEVLAPEALRLSLRDFAGQIVDLYGGPA